MSYHSKYESYTNKVTIAFQLLGKLADIKYTKYKTKKKERELPHHKATLYNHQNNGITTLRRL